MNPPLVWSFDPMVIAALALTALVYWRGRRRFLTVVSGSYGPGQSYWQPACFYSAIIVVVIALESPIDTLGASLFWAHMIQHLLLMMVAAPLFLLGDPTVTLMRGVPLRIRRSVLQTASRKRRVRRGAQMLRKAAAPWFVLAVFVTDLYVWHWNKLFDLTLRNDSVHIVEHVCFFVTSALFWSRIIDQRAIHSGLTYLQRIVYLLIAAAAGNLLSMYFVFAPHPVYPAYAALARRPYGFTALGDQQLAGGLMWIPVLFILGGAAAILFFKWLAQSELEGTDTAQPHAVYSTLRSTSNSRSSGM